MDLHGSPADNLRAAIRGSKRLRGQRIYPETLRFWSDLVRLVQRRQDQAINDGPALLALANQLEREIRGHRDR